MSDIDVFLETEEVLEMEGTTLVLVESDADLELDPEGEITLTLELATTELFVEVDEILEVEVPGLQGVRGLQGIQGPQGDPGVGVEVPFIFTQDSPANPWHIVHGRGSKPSIVVRDKDGRSVDGFGTVYYDDDNTVDVYVGLIAGQATLNF